MSKRDYYEVLGVERSIAEGPLKKAYRKLALQFHPDRNQGDAEAERRFKEISEAYSVISDPEKRQIYDQYGHAGLSSSGQPGFTNVEDIFSHFGDIFGDMFGGGGGGGRRRRRDGPTRGSDFRVGLRLTLEEAAFGCQKDIEVAYPAPCESCEGTGAKDAKLNTCETCKGAGQVAYNRGAFMLSSSCPNCGGRGQTAKTPCGDCKGTGEQAVERTVRVTVPQGIDEGQNLRLNNQGQPGTRGGPAGHLYVQVELAAHEHFQREGFHLVYPLALSFPRAALGGEVQVPVLDEEDSSSTTALKVPAGVQPGDHLVVKGEGVPRIDGRGRGDLVAIVKIEVPEDLSDKARELLQELQDTFDAEAEAAN